MGGCGLHRLDLHRDRDHHRGRPQLIRAIVVAVVLLSASTPSEAQRRPGEPTDRYDPLFKKYSKRYFGPAFDWRVFKAQAMAESNLSPGATSGVGARGIMQLMPTTFREIQSRNPELTCIDHPEWNIAAGIGYDRFLWRLWTEHPTVEDRLNFMLGSYNAGRGTREEPRFLRLAQHRGGRPVRPRLALPRDALLRDEDRDGPRGAEGR